MERELKKTGFNGFNGGTWATGREVQLGPILFLSEALVEQRMCPFQMPKSDTVTLSIIIGSTLTIHSLETYTIYTSFWSMQGNQKMASQTNHVGNI